MKKFTSILLAMILTLCVPIMTIAEADTQDLQNSIETFSTDGDISNEYIYYSDLFYGYSTYLTQNTYLTGLESNTTQVTTNILNEYITTNHFKASAVFEGIGIAADATSVAKYLSDNIGLSSFKFNSELDKANQKFAEALCDVNLTASKQVGSENKYIKNINKFLGVVEKIDKIALEDETYYKDLNKPELYDYFADRAFAVLKEYCTQLEPKLPSLKAELYTVLNETTEILGNLNDALDFTKALALSITMQETQMELVQDIINTQSTSSTLYKGMTRLKNQLSNGFVSYFADTYIKDKVYDKVIGYLPKLTNDAILGGWKTYGSTVTAVVSLVNSVVFKGWLGYDYSEYTSAVMLVQYASDLYNSIKNKAGVFKNQFSNSEIEKFETLYNAYITMKSAAFKECKNIAEHNSIYGLEYMDDNSYIFETENAYQKYVVGVKSFIEMIPYESRTVTNYDVWTLNNDTTIENGSDSINSNTIYAVNGQITQELYTESNNILIKASVFISKISTRNHIYALDKDIDIYVDKLSYITPASSYSSYNIYFDSISIIINSFSVSSFLGTTTNIYLTNSNMTIRNTFTADCRNIYIDNNSILDTSDLIVKTTGRYNSRITVNDGKLKCNNLYLYQAPLSSVAYGFPGQGCLILNNDQSLVEIKEDLIVEGNTDSRFAGNVTINKGSMYVYGDISLTSIYNYTASYGNLILCGNSVQKITNVPVYNIQVQNEKGIELRSYLYVFGNLELNENPIYCSDCIIYLYSNGKLSTGSVYSSIVLQDSYTLNQPLVASGDFTISGNNKRFTNNSTLTVSGNLDIPAHSHITNNGILSVSGDVNLGYINGYTTYYSSITMNNKNSLIEIGGNVKFSNKKCNLISAGTLLLNGTSIQTIENIDAPTIIINNDSSDGVIFKSYISPSVLFNHKGNNFTLQAGGTFADYDGDGILDNEDPKPTVYCAHQDTEIRSAKVVTCCENGYTGDIYCADCGGKLSGGTAIPATGNHIDTDGHWDTDDTQHWHTCYYGTQFDVASHTGGTATCAEKAKCSVCGAEYGEYGAHHLTHHDRVEPDYENDGNIEYWTCDECGKYFSDAEGNNEISADDIIIAKLTIAEYQFLDGEVIIEAPEGAIPEGSLFDVQKIVPPPAEVVEKVKEQIGTSSEVLAYYEIRLSDTDGELIIHLDGEITIKTKMPKQYVESNCVRILQEDETGKLIVMESWWENDYLCYKTDWLEIYN